jgi:hypothetical protein
MADVLRGDESDSLAADEVNICDYIGAKHMII